MNIGLGGIFGGTGSAPVHCFPPPQVSCTPVRTSLVYVMLHGKERHRAAIQMLPSHKSHWVFESGFTYLYKKADVIWLILTTPS